MPASVNAPAHSHARALAVVPHHGSSEDESDESEFPQIGPSASSTSMQARDSDRQRLIKLEKVCTEELTGNCSLFDPNVVLLIGP
jgi:hypothetical protein